MKHFSKYAIGIFVLIAAALIGIWSQTKVNVTPDAALAELKAGNEHHELQGIQPVQPAVRAGDTREREDVLYQGVVPVPEEFLG